MRPLPFLLALLLAGCSSSENRIHIITRYTQVQVSSSDSGSFVRLSNPGVYEAAREVTVPGKEFWILENGQRWRYETPQAGQYILNLLDDTLLSVPATYGRAALVSGIPLRATHSGNATIDSMTAKAVRARERQEEREEADRLRNGRSNDLVLLPGKMERFSANSTARLFLFSEPPRQVEGSNPDDFEYYEVNRYQYFLHRALQQLEEQSDPVKASEQMRREWEQRRNR